jgi:hypothetical protein
VLAPTDVARRRDGHDVVLPLCTERLVRFLQRRAGRGAPLSTGETITVLVSILRGTADALMRTPFAAGEWWLTDAGKPVFVHGEGPDAMMAADVCLAALIDVVPEAAHLRERLGAGESGGRGSATADLAHPRALAAALPEIEAVLFASGTPEPLATTDLAPARARAVTAVTEDTDDVLAHSRRPHWSALARFVDSDLREVAAVGWDALRERRRGGSRSRASASGPRKPRRGVIVVAAVSAAAVVMTGLLWPHRGPVRAEAGAVARPTVSVSASTPTRTPAPVVVPKTASRAPSAGGSEVLSDVRAMLAARIACGKDAPCRASFAEDPARRMPAGAVDDPQQSVELLDDFGGAAVTRVSSPRVTGSGRKQLVVVVRADQKWLIRDVSDVADQPN